MGDTCFDELEFYGSNAAVVHVRGSDTLGACFGVGHRYVRYALDGKGIVEGAVVAEDSAMAVGGVFAETDVGNDEEGGEAGSEEADGLNDRALRVIGCGAEGVFDVGGDGNAEEDHGAEAFADERFEVRSYLVEAAAVLIREGGDESFLIRLVGYKKRVNEHGLIAKCQHVDLLNAARCLTLVNCLSACHDLANGWL